VTAATEVGIHLDLEEVGDSLASARQCGKPELADGVAVRGCLDFVEVVVWRCNALREQSFAFGTGKLQRFVRRPAAGGNVVCGIARSCPIEEGREGLGRKRNVDCLGA
jgi:hypothetical protein